VLNNLLGVVVVNFGIWLCLALLRRWAGPFVRRAFLGYYIVLLPAGFATWFNPDLFYVPVFVLIGLVMITLTARRTLQEATKDDV